MAKNFGESFGDAFTQAMDTSMRLKAAKEEERNKMLAEIYKGMQGSTVTMPGEGGKAVTYTTQGNYDPRMVEQANAWAAKQFGIQPSAVPVQGVTAPTQSTSSGSMPPGMIFANGKWMKDPNAPTADARNALITTKQSESLVEGVIKQSESLKGGYEGIKEIGKGALNRGKGESAKYRTYLSTMPATAVSIYRAVTGDTRLSDSDAQARAYPLLWHPSEDVDVRTQKNDYIKSMVLARKALLSSGSFTKGENGEAITDLGAVSSMAERISAARKAGYTEEEISKFIGSKNGK